MFCHLPGITFLFPAVIFMIRLWPRRHVLGKTKDSMFRPQGSPDSRHRGEAGACSSGTAWRRVTRRVFYGLVFCV